LSIKQQEENPMTIFIDALKAESRRQYPQRFKMFVDYIELDGAIEKQTRHFLSKARNNPQWVEEIFMLIYSGYDFDTSVAVRTYIR
jgi:hypothetical protein